MDVYRHPCRTFSADTDADTDMKKYSDADTDKDTLKIKIADKDADTGNYFLLTQTKTQTPKK